jgi:ribonuclease HI
MIEFWTDGCCKCVNGVGPGGWAFVLKYRTKVVSAYGYSERTTNNIMELSGLYAALDWIIHHNKHKNNIKFYSDSQYVVNGFNMWMPAWKRKGWRLKDKKVPKNLEIWQILDEQKAMIPNLKGQWVRGHNGNVYNEIADMLCNFAVHTKVNRIETFDEVEFNKWIYEIEKLKL